SGYISYLRDPIGLEDAHREIEKRIADREPRFLALMRGGVYANPGSPHRALLDWTGWSYSKLERAVHTEGLESTLRSLRDDGVWSSLTELRRGKPIRRTGLSIPAGDARMGLSREGPGIRATTSGTASAPLEVAYDWELFREEAAFESLLFGAHGVLQTPHAFWLPALPSISGIHNLLV